MLSHSQPFSLKESFDKTLQHCGGLDGRINKFDYVSITEFGSLHQRSCISEFNDEMSSKEKQIPRDKTSEICLVLCSSTRSLLGSDQVPKRKK